MSPIYLMMCGYSLSGKTNVVDKIVAKYPGKFFKLDSRSIHDYLNQFEIFKDDNSIEGNSYKLRQEATDEIQKALVKVISNNGNNILHDSSNRVKEERIERLRLVKEVNPNIKTFIIFVNTDLKILKERANYLDNELISDGRKGVWLELVLKQTETFDIPSASEADYFFEYADDRETELFRILHDILN